MSSLVTGAIYLLFFLSGAAALVYQIVWVRSLALVFGGSHLAVTAVLSTFMAGLAIGSYVVGRRVDRIDRPLRLYALLELGIAGSALISAALLKLYPAIYVALAQGRDEATLYLTVVRIAFSVAAIIVPTMMMGATLPVLSRFTTRQPEHLRRRLSLLYGFNTLGAVVGALAAGFVLLRIFSVSTTLYAAVVTNVVIGLVSLVLPDTTPGTTRSSDGTPVAEVSGEPATDATSDPWPFRLVLWGIGVSGFCALGYEVLWTRVLTLAVGASVYGFTIILVAFLAGIALGSAACGVLARRSGPSEAATRRVVVWFGLTQVIIGIAALVVTIYLRDVPVQAVRLQNLVIGTGVEAFRARVWASFSLAFFYMVVPALFMGAAFPLAGEALARRRRAVGRAVGDVLAANTVGAILGAAVTGLLLIRLFGIETSLQILTVLNIGFGLLVLASLHPRRWPTLVAATSTLAVVAWLSVAPETARAWDRDYFAIFRSNISEAFSTPERVREAVANTDVLYYAEGTESIVSVIQVKGGEQAFITNGRVEASSHLQAQQVQYTLGHLPMLLNARPRNVLVIGMGSGMTAGATSVHPTVEEVTLVEIEPRVRGVARTFETWNHRVLDNPKVRVVVNDGRNFLLTTEQQFDVITSDPIHPWFRGAGALYASEHFALAARRLRPGGVIAQWLPLYELTPENLASVVRTFQQHFEHTMLWRAHFDAVMVGSNSPFEIDELALDQRISEPAIAEDLKRVNMGSAVDLLSYFMMGTESMRRFGKDGTLNTDNHLYLEFSAPFSIADSQAMAVNVDALATHRESLLPYLRPAAEPAAREAQRRWCNRQQSAGRMADPTTALFLAGGATDPQFTTALHRLTLEYPAYAPSRALWAEYQQALTLEPRLIDSATFMFLDEDMWAMDIEISAVLVPVSPTRASVMFVDNRAKTVYGQIYFEDADLEERARELANDVMSTMREIYERDLAAAKDARRSLPTAEESLQKMSAAIREKVPSGQPSL
jgi:spermidine synthase